MAESRQSIGKRIEQVAKYQEKISKDVVDGRLAPYRGGERTRKAFERNTKKRGVTQDYEGTIPLAESIRKQMTEDLEGFAETLQERLDSLIESLGEERAVSELQRQVRTLTIAKRIAMADIEKKAQFITTNANLEFVKTAVGSVRFKEMKTNKVMRTNLTSYVGERGLEDVKKSTGDMFNLITRKSDESKQKLAYRFIEGLEGDEPVDLKKMVKEELQVIDKRAAFIARDQSAKLSSVTAQNRMNEFGIQIYQWIATSDGRTRDLHKKRNGKYFQMGTPVAENYDGMPGIAPNCRCSMLPVLDESQVLQVIAAISRTPKAAYTGVSNESLNHCACC